MLDEQLEIRRTFEEHVRQTNLSPTSPGPALTDEDLDFRWLATPWSTLRRLGGTSSDAEAQHQFGAALRAARRSPGAGSSF